MKTVANIVVEALQTAGIQRVYGMPGGANVALMEALRRGRIPFELAPDESSAVFMASATAQLTGRPGVCLTTLGPGAANAVLGLGHAYLDRSPVLLISAQVPDRLRPLHTHQYLDLHALLGSITKASLDLTPGNAATTLRHALRLTTDGRPGPVHLQLTNEHAQRAVEAAMVDDRKPDLPPDLPVSQLAQAEILLRNARRPLLLLGFAALPGPFPQIRLLAERWDAPVIVTPKAKGTLGEDHPLFAGTIGLTHTDPVYDLLGQADCVLAVGFDVVELVRPWESAVDLIWISPWDNQDPKIPAAVELKGDVVSVLEALATVDVTGSANWGKTRVAAFRKELESRPLPPPGKGKLLPQTVMRVLAENTPEDRLITTDVGSHKILACLEWPATTPNRFLVSNGLSSMGFGLAAAHAASMVLPETQVICLIGDAGLNMSAGGLASIAHFGGRVMVVVFNDGALDLIRSHQLRGGAKPYGTDFHGPDFRKLGEAYGLASARAADGLSLREAVLHGVRERRPTLIEVMIDPVSYPTTPRGVSSSARPSGS